METLNFQNVPIFEYFRGEIEEAGSMTGEAYWLFDLSCGEYSVLQGLDDNIYIIKKENQNRWKGSIK